MHRHCMSNMFDNTIFRSAPKKTSSDFISTFFHPKNFKICLINFSILYSKNICKSAQTFTKNSIIDALRTKCVKTNLFEKK